MAKLDRGILLIAIFKLVKATVLATLGLIVLALPEQRLIDLLRQGMTVLHPGAGFLHRLLGLLDGLSPTKEKVLALLVVAYAAVFTIEGLSLLTGKRWAEWLTVGVTASFVPLEAYELIARPSLGRAGALAINLAVVAYLARRRLARGL